MAAKVNMLKLVQEIRGFAEITKRYPPPRSPGLLLAQMRMHARHDRIHKRKLSVDFNQKAQPDLPHRVRITHVKPDPGTAAPPAP